MAKRPSMDLFRDRGYGRSGQLTEWLRNLPLDTPTKVPAALVAGRNQGPSALIGQTGRAHRFPDVKFVTRHIEGELWVAKVLREAE